MEQATVAKSQVEDAQREQRRHMEESGMKHEPRFFELENGRWAPKLKYDFSLSNLPQKMSDFFLVCQRTHKKPPRRFRSGYSLQHRNRAQSVVQHQPNLVLPEYII